MAGCGASLFGNSSQFIKINGGDFVAIQGSDTRERLITSDLRMPYKQILKSRIILKIGQTNYLLNHLGLGDNATFLCLRATYDPKSVNEEDNYINWSYYDDLTRINTFAQMMVLTGNSLNRIPQLYLTNPSTKYDVFIDVMVAVIDDTYSFFNDTLNQTGTSFTGLEYTDIKSHVIGESIVINDKSSPTKPLIYILLNTINSIEKSGTILIIDNTAYGKVFLQFLTENDAFQAHSLLNYILENPGVDIDSLPVGDLLDPTLYFYSNVGASASLDYIAFDGDTYGVPYNTLDGFTFSTTISLAQSGISGSITRSRLIDLLVDYVEDNRDGYMYMNTYNLIITGTSGVVTTIIETGTYSLTFDFSDIAQNYLDGVIVDLNITA
jgi:hypothetical protein